MGVLTMPTLLTALAVMLAVGTFLLMCALSLGLRLTEKVGLGIALVGLAAQAAIGVLLASDPYAGGIENLAEWEIASHELGRWVLLSRAAGFVGCVGAAMVVGSAGRRSWRQRWQLFPFHYRNRPTT